MDTNLSEEHVTSVFRAKVNGVKMWLGYVASCEEGGHLDVWEGEGINRSCGSTEMLVLCGITAQLTTIHIYLQTAVAVPAAPSGPLAGMVAPLSGQSLGLQRAQVTHGIREVSV